MNVPTIKALLLDTFGTVMNWRDSIIDDFRSFGRRIGVEVDWEAFVHDWKTAYRPGMDAVRTGKWPWTRSEEHTSELQPPLHLVCPLLLEKKKFLRKCYYYIFFQ